MSSVRKRQSQGLKINSVKRIVLDKNDSKEQIDKIAEVLS